MDISNKSNASATNTIEHDEEKNESAEVDGRKDPITYDAKMDLALLREVAAEQPFGKKACKKWQTIFEHLKFNVRNYAAIRRRFETLMKHFITNNAKSLRR